MSRWIQYGALALVCALVIGVYAYTAQSGYLVSASLNPADEYYNLLVRGFRAGQLSLKKEVPAGLVQLPEPYDRTANAPYGLLDLSYYKGKLYLYYGVTPALVLFWPYVALTGHYLSQKDAALIFCVVGFLVNTGLLCALWRRYFGEAKVGLVATGAIALGLAPFTPFLLARCDVYEVSISCGYMLTLLALAAIWKALHEPGRHGCWLAAASLAYGLAVGARPSLLPGAAILLVPVVQAWRERRNAWIALMAATGPLLLIGLGLMLYNALRFDNPFEFGMGYGLGGDRQQAQPFFGLRYLWFHFRVYCLAPARWDGRFPFVHDITVPPLPPGHGRVEHPFGVFTNIPLVWLALAVPLAWRDRSTESRCILRSILTALAVLFVTCMLTVSLYFSASARYEAEYLPALVLLAVIGILSLLRSFAGQPVWWRAVRWCWSLLLGFSVAFNLLVGVERCGEAHCNLGTILLQQGNETEAIAQYEQAVRLNPDSAEAHNNLGVLWKNRGHVPEAIAHYEQALRANPDYAEAHNNLGNALLRAGRSSEAIEQYEQALRLKPDSPGMQYNLGVALERAGRAQEAIEHYEQALRIKPDFAEAQKALGQLRAVR